MLIVEIPQARYLCIKKLLTIDTYITKLYKQNTKKGFYASFLMWFNIHFSLSTYLVTYFVRLRSEHMYHICNRRDNY